MSENSFVHEGVEYVAVPGGTCMGCAAEFDGDFCCLIPPCKEREDGADIIWVRNPNLTGTKQDWSTIRIYIDSACREFDEAMNSGRKQDAEMARIRIMTLTKKLGEWTR